MATRRDRDLPSHPPSVTGNPRLPERAYTPEGVNQFAGGFAFLESDIIDGNILARIDGDETITGDWQFDILKIGETQHSLQVFNDASDFANRSGFRTMVSSAALGSTQLPPGWTYYGFYQVMARRDTLGGYTGLFFGLNSGRMWIAESMESTILPSWHTVFTSDTPQLAGQNGSAAAPVFTFASDLNTGLYRVSENILGVALAGLESVRFDVNGLGLSGQSTGADFLRWPGTSFNGRLRKITDQGGLGINSDSSIVIHAGDNLPATLTGLGIVAGTTFENLYLAADSDIVLLPNQQAAYTAAQRWLFSANGQIRPTYAGAASSPTYSWDGDPDTGWLLFAANEIGGYAGGAVRLRISTTAIRSEVVLRVVDGTSSLPGMSWINDASMGFSRPAGGVLAVSVGGTERFRFENTRVYSTQPLGGPLGSAAAPGINFSPDPNTGLYSPGPDRLAFVTAGVQRGEFEAGGDLVCTGDVVATVP